MSNLTVKLAHDVIKHQEQYSGCVLARAKSIANWDTERKILTQKLWINYRKLFTQTAIETKNTFGTYKGKIINRILNETLDKSLHNDFHKCKNALRSHKNMGMEFEMFKAVILASECDDNIMMHRYMSCVNARQKDDNITNVAFIRWVPFAELSEIILFKLLQSEKKKID